MLTENHPPEKKEKVEMYYALAKEIRGTFMEQTIWIAHFMSDMIANYFCDDKKKRELLFSEVITGDDFRFSTRIALLFDILEKSHPDVLLRTKGLKDRLDKIRRFRNRLAHSHLKATDAEIEKAQERFVTFCFYEDGMMKEQVVTKEDLRDRLVETSKVLDELLQLRTALIPDYDKRA